MQAQGHFEKDSALSWHSRSELCGHSAGTANRESEAGKISARDQTGEGRGVDGISRASFVGNDEQFRERVTFIHENTTAMPLPRNTSTGELYVSLMGMCD